MTFTDRRYSDAMAILHGQMRWPDRDVVRHRFNRAYQSWASQGYARDVAAWKAVADCFPWLTK